MQNQISLLLNKINTLEAQHINLTQRVTKLESQLKIEQRNIKQTQDAAKQRAIAEAKQNTRMQTNLLGDMAFTKNTQNCNNLANRKF